MENSNKLESNLFGIAGAEFYNNSLSFTENITKKQFNVFL